MYKKALELFFSKKKKKVVVHRRVVHPPLGGGVGGLVTKIPAETKYPGTKKKTKFKVKQWKHVSGKGNGCKWKSEFFQCFQSSFWMDLGLYVYKPLSVF